MTVSSQVDSNTYIATGSDATYTFTFRALSSSDLVVQVMDTTGVISTKTLTTDYTVTGVGNYNGGTITFTAGAITVGYTVVIFRDPAALQTTSLQTQGAYSATAVETALDLVTMVDQAHATQIGRAISTPIFESTATLLPSATLRASKYVGFDASGNAAALSGSMTGVPVETVDQIVDTIAAMKALAVPVVAVTYLVRGYYAKADGGGGQFYWNSVDTTADNGGTVIAANVGGTGRWNRIYTGPLTAKQFGCKGDGTTNDTAALQAAMTFVAALGGQLFVDDGTYLCDSLALASKSKVTIRGSNRARAVLKLNSAPTQNIQGNTTWLLLTTVTGFTIADLGFDLNAKEHCAIGFTGSTDFTIENCYIHNAPGTLGNSRPAILAHSSSGVRILRNYVNDVSSWIAFGLSTSLGQITDSVLSDNVFTNGHATSAANCTRSQIVGNTFDTCDGCNLELAGVGTAATDWTITGNTFANSGSTFPLLQIATVAAGGLSRDGVISSNTFVGGVQSGIYCFGDVWNIVINANTVRDSTKGIVLTASASGGCKRVSIIGNSVYDTRTAGARTMTKGIQCDLATSGGGALSGEAIADINISGNTIRNVTDSGVEFAYTSGTATAARVTIDDNQITTCSGLGGIVVATAASGTWTDFVIDSNELAANTVQDFRLSINAADVNTFVIRNNQTLSTTAYTFIAGVCPLLGLTGAGSPEGVVTSNVGGTYTNLGGGAGTTLYAKYTGTGNTGWAAAPLFIQGTATIDPPSLSTGVGSTSTITVTGAAIGDFAAIAAPYDLQGITVTAYVSATDTVSVRIQNQTGGTIDLASGTWRARVMKV